MSDAPNIAARADAAFVQVWTESLAKVLGQITSTEVPCATLTEAPAELTPAAEADLWVLCTCDKALRGEMSFRLNPAVVLGFAQVFMGEPAAPDTTVTPEHCEAVVELLRQVAGMAATLLKPNWGEVQLRLETAAGAPSWPSSVNFWLRAGKVQANDALVELSLSAALTAALSMTSRPEPVSPPVNAPAPAKSSAPPVPPPLATDGKLDLLMDVELAMTLRFGGRRLLLREILDLCPGGVVELDRQVKDPVDLILDGKLVARGEVVIVEGNYGLRVTEVVARQG